MDKAYTMMYDLDSLGRIAGNEFTDYSSKETILESLRLPTPNKGITIETLTDAHKKYDAYPHITAQPQVSIDSWSLREFGKPFSDLEKQYETLSGLLKIDFIEDVLEKLNKGFYIDGIISTNYINDLPETSSLIEQLNNYNLCHESDAALRNRVVYAIRKASSDFRNLRASEVPMEMKPVTKVINELYEEKLNSGTKLVYSDLDPFTIWKIQRENAVGKQDVGIAANSIKAAGALQQFFNERYLSGELDPTALNIVLNFSRVMISPETGEVIKGRDICHYKITNLANAVYPDYETFKKVYRQGIPEGLSQALHPKYKIFAGEKDPETPSEITYYNELLTNIEKYNANYTITGNAIQDEETFIKSLYETLSYEDNVADTLSIFISMATDNAKELALAKMNGRPELLSMPLTMITLGMNIKEVVDICVNLLDKVSDRLDGNRFNGLNNTSVDSILTSEDFIKEVGKENADSLYKIYNTAQEFRMLTLFFKVNLGVNTKYTELSAYLRDLSKRYIEVVSKNNNDANVLPLNFAKLFGDENDPETIKAIEMVKKNYNSSPASVFNIFDVIFGTPHFREQLKAIATDLNIIENMSFTSHTVAEFTHSVEGNRGYKKLGNLEYKGKSDDIKYSQGITTLANLFIIQYALEQMNGLTFTTGQAESVFKNYKSGVSPTTTIGFTNAEDINRFLEFMETSVFPYLNQRMGSNAFLDNLIDKTDPSTKLHYLDLRFDTFEERRDPNVQLEINEASAAFLDFAALPSGITSINGRSLTFGELVYLYTLITSRNSISKSTNTCVFLYASSVTNPLTQYMTNATTELDALVQTVYDQPNSGREYIDDLNITHSETPERQRLNAFLMKLEPFINALKEDNGVYTKNYTVSGTVGNTGVYSISYNINKNFIRTMDPGTILGDIYITDDRQRTISILSSYLKESNLTIHDFKQEISSDLIRMSGIFIQGNLSIPFTVTFNNRIDNNTNRISKADILKYCKMVNLRFNQLDSFITKVRESGVNTNNYIKNSNIFNSDLAQYINFDQILDIPIDDIRYNEVKTLKEFFKSDKANFALIIPTDNTLRAAHSHVEYMGLTPLLILNQNINTFDFIVNDLFSIYFLMQQLDIISDLDKLAYALGFLYREENQGFRKLNEFEVLLCLENLSALEAKIKTNPLIGLYIKNLIENDNEYLRLQCRSQLALFSNALLYKDIYYKSDNTDLEKDGDLFKNYESTIAIIKKLINNPIYKDELGQYKGLQDFTVDIINKFILRSSAPENKIYRAYKLQNEAECMQAEEDRKYLWIRLGEIDGKVNYCRIEDLHNLSKPVLKRSFLLNKVDFKKVASLKFSLNTTVELESVPRLYDESLHTDFQEVNVEDLLAGDLVKTLGIEFYITNILYSTDNTGNIICEYIGYNLSNNRNVLTSKTFTGLKTVQVRRLNTKPNVLTSSKPNVAENFSNLSAANKTALLNQLVKDNFIWSDDTVYVFVLNLGNGIIQVLDEQGQVKALKVDSIDKIQIKSISDIDKYFLKSLYTPKIVVKKDDFDKGTYYFPELVDGYNKESFRTTIDQRSVEAYLLTPGWALDSIIIPRIPLGNVYNNGKLEDYKDLRADDYLVTYKKSSGGNKHTIVYKVISVSDDQIVCLWGNADNRSEFGIKVLKPEDFTTSFLHFSKIPTIRQSRLRVNNTTRTMPLFSASKLLLNLLASKFNSTIEFVDKLENDEFAMVKNGKVFIAVSKETLDRYNKIHHTSITTDLYVLLQAVHEFSHLMLTYMKISNPEMYVTLLKQFDLAVLSITGTHYTTDFQKREEYIVRQLETFLRNDNKLGQVTISLPELNVMINNGFKALLGITDTDNTNRALYNCLKPDFLGDKTNIDIQLLRIKNIKDELLLAIKCE